MNTPRRELVKIQLLFSIVVLYLALVNSTFELPKLFAVTFCFHFKRGGIKSAYDKGTMDEFTVLSNESLRPTKE